MIREFASGGVVFRKVKGKGLKVKVLWLVAKSSTSEIYPESYWRLPKGWLDDEDGGKSPGPITRGERKAAEEELQKGALREVEEEGGVEAKIVKKIGTAPYFRARNTLKFVTYYLMEWISDLPEGPGFETSEVAWLPFVEAKGRLKYSGEKKILEKAKGVLDLGIQKNLL